MQDAEAEGDKRASRTFKWALEVEKIHEVLYRQAAETLNQGKDLPETEYYVCPICGYTHEGKMTEKCPVCGVMPEKI